MNKTKRTALEMMQGQDREEMITMTVMVAVGIIASVIGIFVKF